MTVRNLRRMRKDEAYRILKETDLFDSSVPFVVCDHSKPKASSHFVRYVCISDTHGLHEALEKPLPYGDVLIHAGDATHLGKPKEFSSFVRWWRSQPHPVKIFVGGNHDLPLDPLFYAQEYQRFGHKTRLSYEHVKDFLNSGSNYLDGDCITVYGQRICGLLYPERSSVCLGRLRPEWRRICYKRIAFEQQLDVLVTHAPPFSRCDCDPVEHGGSFTLLEAVKKYRPRVHVFGHCHEGHGCSYDGHTLYVNCSIVDDKYKAVFKPIVFDLPKEDCGMKNEEWKEIEIATIDEDEAKMARDGKENCESPSVGEAHTLHGTSKEFEKSFEKEESKAKAMKEGQNDGRTQKRRIQWLSVCKCDGNAARRKEIGEKAEEAAASFRKREMAKREEQLRVAGKSCFTVVSVTTARRKEISKCVSLLGSNSTEVVNRLFYSEMVALKNVPSTFLQMALAPSFQLPSLQVAESSDSVASASSASSYKSSCPVLTSASILSSSSSPSSSSSSTSCSVPVTQKFSNSMQREEQMSRKAIEIGTRPPLPLVNSSPRNAFLPFSNITTSARCIANETDNSKKLQSTPHQ